MAKTIEATLGVEVKTVTSTAFCLRLAARAGALAALGLLLANCASQPQQRGYSSQQQREFGSFASRKYGTASPRVYGDTGAAMPKGGGREHIGKAYSIAGRRYVPHDRPVGSSQVGMASWYGAAFHGRKTANGEIYDRRSFTAAHPTMPLPSYARVTNLRNGSSVIVRVNDRGPYHGGRIMDVSERVADSLAFKGQGTGRIRVDYLGRAGIGGSDDVRLAQTLTMDGSPAVASYIPASYGNGRSTVQVASATVVPVASAAPVQAAAFTPRQPSVIAPVAAVAAPVVAPSPVIAPAAKATAVKATAAKEATAAKSPAAASPAKDAQAAKDAPATKESAGRSAAIAAAAAIAQKNDGRGMQALASGRAPVPPGRPVNLGPIPGANAPAKTATDRLSRAPRAGQPVAGQTRPATQKSSKLAQLD